MSKNTSKHDEDFYGWILNEVSLLRQGRLHELDIEHLIEELECMGASEKRELINRLAQLLMHLLKWQYQPDRQGHSWIYTIMEQRKRVKYVLEDSPSIKNQLAAIMMKSYSLAIDKAAKETALEAKTFPKECPYSFEQLMDENFYPN